MDITAAGLALAEQIASIDPELTAFSWNPSSIVAPAVFPKEWEIDFDGDQVMLSGDGAPVIFTVWVLVQRSDDQSGQTTVQGYAASAPSAVYLDPTLDGNVSDVFVTGMRAPGTQEYAGADYLLLELTVRAYG